MPFSPTSLFSSFFPSGRNPLSTKSSQAIKTTPTNATYSSLTTVTAPIIALSPPPRALLRQRGGRASMRGSDRRNSILHPRGMTASPYSSNAAGQSPSFLTSPSHPSSSLRPSTSSSSKATLSTTAPSRLWENLAEKYDSKGRPKDYNVPQITDTQQLAEWWIEKNKDLLPENPKSILDFGTGKGGTLVRLGKKYPHARLIGTDTDAQSAQFITSGIINAKHPSISNPQRLTVYTIASLRDAIVEGSLKKDSIELIYSQAVFHFIPRNESKDYLADTLDDFYDLLPPGGTTVFSCWGEHHDYDKKSKEFYLRNDFEILSLLLGSGFTMQCAANIFSNEQGIREKTTREMDDVLTHRNMPDFPEGKFWHSIYFIVTK